MYEYLRCECCSYVPDEFDLAQINYYWLEVCHHCGRKVCPQCLSFRWDRAKMTRRILKELKDDDDDRWDGRCHICLGYKKEDIKGFHIMFPLMMALHEEG